MIIVLTLAVAGTSRGQEFKVAQSSGRLEIYTGQVTVEGHNGSDIIFSGKSGREEKDERAEGLRLVNSLGLEDNTGLGLNVTDKGDVIEVRQLKQVQAPDVKILVPKGVIVSFKHESQYAGKARFVNLPNEIEVSAVYNSVELDGVTGPLTVQTTYGSVTADLSAPIREPVSIVSIYGFIDLTLPVTTAADLELSTSYGDIFVAPELKLDVTAKEGMKVYSNKISAALNGGGADIGLTCNYGKIYLRKK